MAVEKVDVSTVEGAVNAAAVKETSISSLLFVVVSEEVTAVRSEVAEGSWTEERDVALFLL
jgi:transcriptional regulator of acetoin/glycerol metabolism